MATSPAPNEGGREGGPDPTAATEEGGGMNVEVDRRSVAPILGMVGSEAEEEEEEEEEEGWVLWVDAANSEFLKCSAT